MTPTQFKDRHSNTWDLKLTLGKALLVDRSDFSIYLPVDHPRVLLTRFDRETIELVLTDNSLLFAVIGVIVRNQFEDAFGQPDQEDIPSELQGPADSPQKKAGCKAWVEDYYQQLFADSIDGSCIEPARTAFVESLGDFFPAAKTVLSTSLTKLREYQEKALKRLNDLTPLIDLKAEELMDSEIKLLKEKLSTKSSLPFPSSDLNPESGSPSRSAS